MSQLPLCVRVSLFQAPSDHALAGLLRSRVEDYRGDVLIPLATPDLSGDGGDGGNGADFKEGGKNVAVVHLIEALEIRLSRYCVLHMSNARARTYMEEHHMTTAAVEAYSPHHAGKDDEVRVTATAASVLCCADCLPSLSKVTPTAAAAGKSSEAEQAPWIRICQLQRMTGGLRSSIGDGGACAVTAEAWMLRQHGPPGLLVPEAEAAELRMAAVANSATVGNGECFAAFFQLGKISRCERERRLRALRVTAAVSAPAQSSGFFTVQVAGNTVRIGVPSQESHAADAGDASGAKHSPLPSDLGSVVLSRLEVQRGVRVRRLVDTQTEAAVLPCESASMLLAASLTSFRAEWGASGKGAAVRPHGEDRTQQLRVLPSASPPSSSPSAAAAAAAAATPTPTYTQKLSSTNAGAAAGAAGGRTFETGSDLVDHLVGLRAQQRREDLYYYDGFNAHDWGEQRTAISMSELESERGGLQRTSVASQNSKLTAIYPPSTSSSLSSPLRNTSQGTRTSGSVIAVSAENSRSNPFPQVYRTDDDASDLTNTSDSSDGATSNSEALPRNLLRGVSDGTTVVNVVTPLMARDRQDLDISPVHLPEQSTFALRGDDLEMSAVRDSLRDMNEVFVYEDEETLEAPPAEAAAEGDATKTAGYESLMSQQRRSSLVWSTPAARGAVGGGVCGVAESSVSATPLTYRTSTQLSVSPHESPAVIAAAAASGGVGGLGGGGGGGGGAFMVGGRPIQRLAFSLSPAPSASTSVQRSEEEEDHAKEAHTAAAPPTTSIVAGSDSVENGATGRELLSVHDGEGSTASNVLLPPARGSVSPSASSSSVPFAPTGEHGERTMPPLPYRAMTPPSAEAASRHFACTPPSCSALSPPPSAQSGYLERRRRRGDVMSEERTTPLPSCATPPSRSHTSDQALRRHLRSIEPLPTQSSEGCAPSHSSRFSSAKRPRETPEGDALLQPSPVRWASEGVAPSASSAVRSAVTSALRSAPHTPPRSPVTATDASLPSTVVATKGGRHRSPIYFSPEELADMAADVLAHSERGSTSPLTSAQRHSPLERHYGPFVASYPLRPRELTDAEVDVAQWGYTSSVTPLRSSPHSARRQQQQQQQLTSTPQRGPALSGLGNAQSSAPRVFPFISGVPGSLSERRQQQAPWEMSLTGTDSCGAVLMSGPRVTSQRLRRSESHSASGVETWVRFSDVEAHDASSLAEGGGTRTAGAEAGEEETMLVTQQEIPDYQAETGSSESVSDADEEEEDEESSSEYSSSSASESG